MCRLTCVVPPAGATLHQEACSDDGRDCSAAGGCVTSRAECSRRWSNGIGLPTAILTPTLMQLPLELNFLLLCIVFGITFLIGVWAAVQDALTAAAGPRTLHLAAEVAWALVINALLCFVCTVISDSYKARRLAHQRPMTCLLCSLFLALSQIPLCRRLCAAATQQGQDIPGCLSRCR